jgi:hypothetical protein
MLLRTIYERIQMNLIVNFKGNRAKRHACARSNICQMPHPITDCSLASDQKKKKNTPCVFVVGDSDMPLSKEN